MDGLGRDGKWEAQGLDGKEGRKEGRIDQTEIFRSSGLGRCVFFEC